MMLNTNIEVKPGDIFCTRNPMWLGRAINGIQTIWASDNKSVYSHAGIIIDDEGTTFEALWTVKEQNLEEAYTGCDVIIGRHCNMTWQYFLKGFSRILDYKGRRYPFHRLVFHIIPPLAKYISSGRFLVCSELTGKFIRESVEPGFFYKGRNPDHIADMIRRWKTWDVVYEGALC